MLYSLSSVLQHLKFIKLKVAFKLNTRLGILCLLFQLIVTVNCIKQKIQNQVVHFSLGLYRNAPIMAYYWELLMYKYIVSAVKLWHKICRLQSGDINRTNFECT